MQNLIVLCQRCFTWVETHSDMCPECGAEVCLDAPDTDRETLAEVIGKPLVVLGPLRVERLGLPNYGFLVGTTGGLVFLPRLHRRVNGAWEGVSSQRLPRWWPFQGDLASPRFLTWLRRPLGAFVTDDQKSTILSETNVDSLADRLMDSPGAFFTDHRFIRSVTVRRRMVRLERSLQRGVDLVDETDDRSLCLSLNSFLAQVDKEKLRRAL